MSGQFLNNFYTYQKALLHIGSEEPREEEKVVEYNAEQNINDIIREVSHAEDNLTEVRSVSSSYSEILKMIM